MTSSVLSLNQDQRVIEDFGREWKRYDQSSLPDAERAALFDRYFSEFPWQALPPNAVGFDLGCGSGRWAFLAAQRVGQLHCIDPSAAALDVARRNLQNSGNCHFHHASVAAIPLADGSMDFGYSLGVLHHVPDTAAGVKACVAKLKPGAPFLLYLYYALDNRPFWFRAIWRATDAVRRMVSRLPHALKVGLTQLIAALIYWPLARIARLAEMAGSNPAGWPLAFYRNSSFYTMRTDALDRFGTRLEQRFTRSQIQQMMEAAGLTGITFRNDSPYWCAVGIKK